MASTVWKGRIAFGMVSVPVRLYKAARRERIKFHHVYRQPENDWPENHGVEPEEQLPEPIRPTGSVRPPAIEPNEVLDEFAQVVRVRNAPVGSVDDAPVPRESILKGFETEEGRYAVFAPREIAALRAKTSTECEILEFVRLSEIDPIFFDASYYVAPDKGGEKPYAVLFRALEKTGYVGLGSLAMHGREHAIVIRAGKSGLILHTLFYANEVGRDREPQADNAQVTSKEMELAALLIDAMAAKFEPEKLKDTLEERLRELIEKRPAIGLGAPPEKAQVIDIMEALRRSLEAKRKPIRTETRDRAAKSTPKRRRV